MARDRYLLMLRFLHFANNDLIDPQDPNRDRLGKIGEMLDLIRIQCSTVFQPGRDLCVDESLLLFKGCLAFKQYIRTKQARFGIKLFELCTDKGILLDFLVYHGKMSQELVTIAGQDLLTSEKIPITLMEKFLNKGHRLFLDNYCNSPKLVQYLLEQGTKVVGTVRPNRQNFNKVSIYTTDRGLLIFLHCNCIINSLLHSRVVKRFLIFRFSNIFIVLVFNFQQLIIVFVICSFVAYYRPRQ